MIVEWGLGLLAGALALVYGAAFIERPASRLHTLVRAGAIGLLTLLAVARGGPVPLVAALALSALADAALEGRGRIWLSLGLGGYILADLIYALMFIDSGGGHGALIAEPVRGLGVALALAVFAGLGAWTWDRMGALRGEVTAFVASTAITTIAAMTLPHYLWAAALGDLCRLASGAAAASELVRGARTPLSGQLVWWPYIAGQGLIAAAILQ